MCFSESISFAASALLIPAGLYCIEKVFPNREYLPLACVPLVFGIQQGFEGIVWQGINSSSPDTVHFGAMAFLFFSHWFWLFWIPLVVSYLEHDHQAIRRICNVFVIVGVLYGAFLYVPLFIYSDWLSVTVVQGSIQYQARFLGDFVPVALSRFLYATTILIPLWLSSRWDIRIWGVLIFLFALVSRLFFNYAFVSIWCFFAALISVYIVSRVNMFSSEIDRSNVEIGE